MSSVTSPDECIHPRLKSWLSAVWVKKAGLKRTPGASWLGEMSFLILFLLLQTTHRIGFKRPCLFLDMGFDFSLYHGQTKAQPIKREMTDETNGSVRRLDDDFGLCFSAMGVWSGDGKICLPRFQETAPMWRLPSRHLPGMAAKPHVPVFYPSLGR